MDGFNYVFDATQYAPEQSAGVHPPGKFAAYISDTDLKPIKDDPEGRPRFVVEFTTEAGRIQLGYNLWSTNVKAVEISQKQLSALSHAVGIFRFNMQTKGAELRNARLMIEVGWQTDKDGKQTQYTEVKKVFDAAGNEPGKPQQQPNPQQQNGYANGGMPQNTAAAQPPQGQQPQPPQAPGGWGGAPQGGAIQAPQGGAAWGGGNPNLAPPQTAPAAQQWAQGATNGAATNGAAPAWARN